MQTLEPTKLFIMDQEHFFKDLGKRLSELRKERGLTQVQLAELSNCSQQLIASYEAGCLNIPVSLAASSKFPAFGHPARAPLRFSEKILFSRLPLSRRSARFRCAPHPSEAPRGTAKAGRLGGGRRTVS
jgi:DNA-binding XRE family transcriptional regulator